MYHFVCPAKYRKSVFTSEVEKTLKEVCLQISERYEIVFLEIGVDENRVHFLVQSVPMYSPKKIIRIIKSLTATEIFLRIPEVKKQLWGGQFWSNGYFVSTVGKHGDEKIISNYVKNQGQSGKYKMLHKDQPRVFSNETC